MGSMNETSRFVRPLLEFLFPEALPETLTYFHGYIRKFAHFVEYAVLGMLAFRAFRTFFVGASRATLFAFVLAAAVAILDEYQQSFNPQRTSSPYDVLIDLAGALTTLIVLALFARKP